MKVWSGWEAIPSYLQSFVSHRGSRLIYVRMPKGRNCVVLKVRIKPHVHCTML